MLPKAPDWSHENLNSQQLCGRGRDSTDSRRELIGEGIQRAEGGEEQRDMPGNRSQTASSHVDINRKVGRTEIKKRKKKP